MSTADTETLREAVEAGNFEIIYNLDKKSRNKMLLIAAEKNELSMINCLLNCDTDVNCTNSRGETPLSLVKWGLKDYKNLIKLLLEKNADPNIKDQSCVTPLLKLLQSGADAEIVKLLIDNKADVFVCDNIGNSALHYAVTKNFKDVKVLQILLDKGLDINCQNMFSRTALYKATFFLDIKVIKFLLKRGAKVNEKGDTDHVGLLELFSKLGNYDVQTQTLEFTKAFMNQNDNSDEECDEMDDDPYKKNVVQIRRAITLLLQQTGVEFLNSNYQSLIYCCKSDWAWQIVVKNLVWLLNVNEPVSSKLIEEINNSKKMHKYFLGCKSELTIAKEIIFFPPYSYFSVLDMSKNVTNIKKLIHLTKKEEFVSKFESNLHKFSYYKNELRKILKDAKK